MTIKTLILVCTTTTILAGCSDAHPVSNSSDNSETVIIVKNNIDIDDAQSFLLNGGKLSYGVNAVNITGENMDPYDTGYINDVILVKKEGVYGFYNYEGDILLSPQFDSIDQNPWVIFASKENTTYAIESDFTSYNDNLAGVGGAFPEISIQKGKVVSGAEPVPQCSDSDGLYLVNSEDGSGIIDQNNNVVCEMHGWYSCGASVFANGYVFLSDTEWTYDPETDQEEHGALMLFDVSGNEILDTTVEDAGYMWNGYAPVKQNGKWGFINENGESVTDNIFDEARSLYDGKAYVKYKGQWMIIDIVNSVKNGCIDEDTMDLTLGL